MQLSPSVLAVDSNGAAGSPIDQVAIASVAALVITLGLLWLGMGHRHGKVKILGKLALATQKMSGFPGWAAFPILVAATSLIIAVFGMYWDISLHIDVGRDPGPLANPAHYFILLGLFGIFAAGFFSIIIPSRWPEQPGPTGFQFTPRWRAPLGGILICACGAFALIGFPLDDVWHRLFGQDVTLWGPTHLMLIGGASMTLIGIGVLAVEGLRVNLELDPPRPERPFMTWVRRIALTGGLMLGLSTFQAEFDFGIPQFRFLFEPVMLMIAAGVGLVSIRVWAGAWSTIGAVLFFLGLRLILDLLNGPVLGQTMPAMPIYLGCAVAVELAALLISPKRLFPFSLLAGALLGTIGLGTEWAWSQLVMPFPLSSGLAPQGIPFGIAAALAGALIGGWIGSKLMIEHVPGTRSMRLGALAGALTISVIFAVGLQKPPIPGGSVTVALKDATIAPGDTGAGGRAVTADIQVNPPSYIDNPAAFTATAWQGGGIVIDHLKKVGPGHYVSTEPVPVFGDWKALLRLVQGRSLMSVPIYLPLDTAIPAAEVPASATFTRPFIADHKVMQREQKTADAWLTTAAYIVVGAISLLLLLLLVWGLHRLGDPNLPAVPRRRKATSPAAKPSAVVPEATA